MSTFDKNIVFPSTLSIITTYRCSSACENCCFQCNPLRKEMLSIDEIKKYIKEAVDTFPSIKVLVLTGGECFLLQKGLDVLIEYATILGLSVRVVTNGFWAKEYFNTLSRVKELADVGLKEINFSTGDEHLEYVPFNSVKNGLLASIANGLTTVLNVESADYKKFNSKLLLEDSDLSRYIKDGRLCVLNGIWVPFKKTDRRMTNPQAYFQKYGYTESVDFDENMLNLILALGDEDINKAISLGDIKQVLALMREKGLFKLNSYNQIELTEKQKQELISTLGMDQSQQDNFVCGVAAVCVFYVAVAVVSVAAVAYTAAAGVTAVASLGVYTSVKAYGRSASIQRILDNNSVLKIWSLKGDMEKTYVTTNLFIEEEINKALDAIEEINPSAFENRNARGILENIIKLNILY